VWIKAVLQISAALVLAVTASPFSTTTRHVVHERKSEPPPRWSRHARSHPAATIPVWIGLTQQNLHRAEEFMNQVAHPSSPDYGRHWSKEKAADMFAPTKETVEAVKEWLHSLGIDPSRIRMSKSRIWLNFNATVSEVERLLQTEYPLYKHEMGHNHVACESYSLPPHLTEHIDIVTPTVHFDTRTGSPGKTIHHKHLPVQS